MSNKQEDLTKIDRSIKDYENRIKSFNSNIDTIQKEIDFLFKLESELETNITVLKKKKIVTLAEEYQKSKTDLKKTKVKLTQLKSDKIISEKNKKELENMLQKTKEIYDKLAKQSENNVLLGKFGKKRV